MTRHRPLATEYDSSAFYLDAVSSRQRERLDIAVILHDFPLGGTERIAIRLANEWAAGGNKVTLICGSMKGPLLPLVGASVRTIALDPAIERGAGSRYRLGQAAAGILRDLRADIVFIPGNFHWRAIPALMRLPAAIRPRIAVQLSTPLERYDRGPIRQFFYDRRMRRLLRGVDAAISLEDRMTGQADRILGRRITRRIATPALADATPRPRRIDPAGRTIVAAGRLEAVKGFDIAIAAFARLQDSDARLVILGEGPMRAQLEQLAVDLGVADRVELPGYVPCIRPWLDKARMFVLSSRYEGYPAVLVEAIAAGRPVVATRCTPAVADLVDGTGFGRSVAINDPEALACAMAAMLDSPLPDVHRMAASVEPFRIESVAIAYTDLFESLCAA
ncbi:MAG: glycosyltransferase [Rhizorhabdus sp.]|nr:glycosyltransferase [Rhizorhabdus sp.]